MERYTQKQLKNLVNTGAAVDITRGNNETRKQILNEEECYTQIGYSAGVYGCNGMLLKDHKTGKLYAVTSRTSAIYIYSISRVAAALAAVNAAGHTVTSPESLKA